MNLRQFATAMTIGLCAISVASFIAARAADASTPTSYVTANMAGAGGTTSKYSSSATVRVSMTGTIRYTVAAGNPSGIAVQEACKEQFGWDDLDELVYDWTAYQVEAVSTGKVMGSCYQANAAFATGSWFWGDASDPLKSDGTSESRYVVCLKTHGYVYTTVCSTHITNKRVPDVRADQANEARNFFTYVSVLSPMSYGAWLGGDWGLPNSNTVSQPGATLAGRDVSSDQDLIWAPYTWH